MRGGSYLFRALGALAILWGSGQLAGDARAGEPGPNFGVRPKPAPVCFFAILGEVWRPGVFESAEPQPQLVELVNRAGGPTATALGNVRVIRGGRGGYQAFLADALNFPLLPNDIVILDSRDSVRDRTGPGSQIPEDVFVQLGLVNLIARPIVLDVSAEKATLRTVLALLHQPVGGAAQVTIVRPAGGPEVVSLSQASDVPLDSGSVLVFDPTTVNPGLLPRLPATVPVPANRVTEMSPPAPERDSTPRPASLPETILPLATSLPARIEYGTETGPQVLSPRTSAIPPTPRRSTRAQPGAAHTPPRRSSPAGPLIVGCLVLSAMLLRWFRPLRFARGMELATRPAARLRVWIAQAISTTRRADEAVRVVPPESEFAGYSLQESPDPIDAAFAMAGPHYLVEAPEPAGDTVEVEQESRPAIATTPSRKLRIDGGHLTGKGGALDRALSALDEGRR
jgi:hypothetical protein